MIGFLAFMFGLASVGLIIGLVIWWVDGETEIEEICSSRVGILTAVVVAIATVLIGLNSFVGDKSAKVKYELSVFHVSQRGEHKLIHTSIYNTYVGCKRSRNGLFVNENTTDNKVVALCSSTAGKVVESKRSF